MHYPIIRLGSQITNLGENIIKEDFINETKITDLSTIDKGYKRKPKGEFHRECDLEIYSLFRALPHMRNFFTTYLRIDIVCGICSV